VLGKYSYALYLLHDPAIVFTVRVLFQPNDHTWPWLAEQLLFYALVFAISLAAAWLSWRLLEAPANRLGRRFQYQA
jgi:peptidoglycan/LPS O-acetylase OafA/YrhL